MDSITKIKRHNKENVERKLIQKVREIKYNRKIS